MSNAPLLIEIGCEEIPARMIPAALRDLAVRVERAIDQAGLAHGAVASWGGPRRLAVRVDEVADRQDDRDERVLGPPAKVAFDAQGKPTPAGTGFAKKQGIDPADLVSEKTERGDYVAFTRHVAGKTLGQVLCDVLPGSIAAMSFPKSMRWADGDWRWVRPVHWVLALHGKRSIPLPLFGIVGGAVSLGHRFFSDGAVKVRHPDDYLRALEKAHVVADPARRRDLLTTALAGAAEQLGGRLVDDAALLEEVADLVEWPGVVGGNFSAAYLDLPPELLVTTLRHHQKCFSIEDGDGRVMAAFVAVTNTPGDPAGHIRRGNEWVIGGRLDDARFFWREDCKTPLSARSASLAGVVFHAKLGSYADKAARMADIADRLAARLGLDDENRQACREAATLAKNDLVTGTVGEFPELQGRVGGLLLQNEGKPAGLARAIYEHYRPAGPDDAVASTDAAAVVAVADKLDSIAELIRVGQSPTGSKDPFALRRAGNGIFRTVVERGWAQSLADLCRLTSRPHDDLLGFLLDRFQKYLREIGFTSNEILAVFRPNVSETDAWAWPLGDIVARLEALRGIRRRDDFANLVDLTKRVDNILTKNRVAFDAALKESGGYEGYEESHDAAIALRDLVARYSSEMGGLEEKKRFVDAIEILARFIDPVERFFDGVLVMDPKQPKAMLHRRELLEHVHGVLTRCFDIRELAGQAERRSS